MTDTAADPFRTCLLCRHFYLEAETRGYSEMTPGVPADWGCCFQTLGQPLGELYRPATPLQMELGKAPGGTPDLRSSAQRCRYFQLSDEAEEMRKALVEGGSE